MLTDAQGHELVKLARASIIEALGGARAPRALGAWALEPGAAFVTLRRGERLHGCIGSLEPHRALVDDVAHNAVSAALHDPRATHIELGDVGALSVEVTVLGPLESLGCFDDEEDAVAALRPGVDGVVIRGGGRRATFLPQVWEQLPEPHEFMRHLKVKAGFSASFWSPAIEVLRYGQQHWVEAPRGAGRA